MYVIILPLSFLLLWIVVIDRMPKEPRFTLLRESFVRTSLIASIVLVGMTEILSLFGSITPVAILITWLVAASCLSGYIIKNRLFSRIDILYRFRNLPFSTGEYILLAGVALLLIISLIIGLCVPPNNWDSMTYHLARIAHWIQNESVAHYPTHITRQHYQPPFAEYVILHLQLLSNTDRFSGLVQWIALVGAMASVSLLVKELGGNYKAQLISLVLVATLPVAVLQSNSTQNDLVVAYWILVTVLYLYRLRSSFSLQKILIIGLSTGLAILTKSTAYLFLFPFFVAFSAEQLMKAKGAVGKIVRVGATVLICIIALNIGHYARNVMVYNHPLGGTAEDRATYSNEIFTPQVFISNVIRNVVLHLRTPYYYWGRALRLSVLKIHELLNLDLHDSRTTYFSSGNMPFFSSWNEALEDSTGNFFHTLLIGISMLVVLRPVQGNKLPRHLYTHLFWSLLTFGLFCIYLRWQEWATRLHTALFFLLIVIVAFWLQKQRSFIQVGVLLILLIHASIIVLFNFNKPVLPIQKGFIHKSEKELRTITHPDLLQDFQAISEYVEMNDCRKVGLQIEIDDGDYLYWVFLNKFNDTQRIIKHVNVNNPSQKLSNKEPFVPDCIIVSQVKEPVIKVDHSVYYLRKAFNSVSLYEPK